MRVLFLGGDKRYLEIINYFMDKDYEIDVLGYDNITFDNSIKKVKLEDLEIGKYNILIFPVSGVGEDYSINSFSDEKIVLNRDLLKDINALIFTGIKTKSLEEMLKLSNSEVITLMENEDIKKNNSIPTVEGIIADLVLNTDITINNSKVLILGYGNVGKGLALKLKMLGAIITVGVLDMSELNGNYDGVITSDCKSLLYKVLDSDIVVNTVPQLIINEDILRNINNDIYILDISSYPYGVDFKTANELHIKNKLYLGIPGKVAPKTSGQILANEIGSIINRRLL